MQRVVGITGAGGSGKTALAGQLVSRLRDRGCSVGYLEHAHAGFDLDRSGSDSWRVREAGADVAAVVGGDRTFVVDARTDDAERGLLALGGCDIVLAEGFHDAPWPKVSLRRPGAENRSAAPPILAEVAADASGTVDEATLQDLVEAILHADAAGPTVRLLVDGRPVPLARFATEIVAGTVLGLVGTLKGVDAPEVVELVVRPAEPPAPS